MTFFNFFSLIMPNVTLPDGTVKFYNQSITVADVASSIGSGLAKAAIAGEIDGQLVDTSYMIEDDASVAIITNKDDKALEVIRHSTAHLLAQATQQLYPNAVSYTHLTLPTICRV